MPISRLHRALSIQASPGSGRLAATTDEDLVLLDSCLSAWPQSIFSLIRIAIHLRRLRIANHLLPNVFLELSFAA